MSEAIKDQKINRSTDEVLQEMWRIKDELSAAYANNLEGFFADLRKRQKLSGHPIVNLQKRKTSRKLRKPNAKE